MRVVLGILLLAALAGCGGAGTSTKAERAPEPTAPAAPALPAATAIHVPSGFRAEIYARGLKHPTAMAFGPDGRLYVTEDVGRVVRVGPGTRRPGVMLRNLPTPLGLAWIDHRLYVSEQGRLDRFTLSGGSLGGRHALIRGLPFGRHQQDNVVVGPDGRLYVGSGSTCDACAEADRRSAAVLSIKPDGTGFRIVARGLRNPYGLAFRPGTNRLFATVNGRDDLPDASAPEPAEMLVRVKQGAFYGWPACWPSWLQKRMRGPCTGVTRPVAYLETHSSADGIAFATGTAFPERLRAGAFVALWGQYLSRANGRRVVFVPLPSGRVTRFATGFAHPLALAFDGKGAMLVADWERGTIYRIQRRGQP
jgi:glucose/arabinose dehydrogenase